MSQEACLAKIENAFLLAEEYYGKTIPRVRVLFNGRLTATAGRAFFSSKGVGTKIDLSTKLLALNGQDFIDTTPGHEAAHIIAAYLFQERGHGASWKEVMKVIGQAADRTHSMKIAASRHKYRLDSGYEMELSTVMHNKLQRGIVYYTTPDTKEPIMASHYVK